MHPNSTTATRQGISRVPRGPDFTPEARTLIRAAGLAVEDTAALFPADLGPDGRFGERWFIVARDRLVALDPAIPESRVEEPYEGITAIEHRKLVGGGAVLVRRGERQRELIRCTTASARAIQAALSKLNGHLGIGDRDAPPHPAPDGAVPPPKPESRPAAARLTDEQMRVFIGQLDGMDEQRHCAGCGLPLRKDTAVCPVCFNRGRTLWRIFRFAAPYRRSLITLSSLLLTTVVLRVAPPFLQGRIFDVALVPAQPAPADQRVRFLILTVAALLAAHVMSAVLRIAGGRVAVTVGGAISRDLRAGVFNHLQWLSLSYFDRRKTGALMSRVHRDTERVESFLVDGVQHTVISLLEIVIIALILFWLNWRLALLVLLPAPLVVIAAKSAWRKIHRRYRRQWEAVSRLSAVLNDSLRGIRVVKAFGGEEHEIRRFAPRNEDAYQTQLAAERTWITLMPILNLLMGLGLYFVLLAGGIGLIRRADWFGPLTPGLLVQFIGYLPMLYMPLQVMTRLNEWLTRSMTAAERVFEILDTETEVPEAPEPLALPDMRGRIEFRDVVFGYEKHSPVIKGLNLTVEPGEMVGLVGHSGAGKSTTINLTARLYDPDEGSVLVDGTDIRRLRIRDLRNQIGVVLQETFLFAGTVFENIVYGRPDASRAEAIRAAKLANAHGFIMDRDGAYDSEVEEGGNNFSSGEKQRIAIARAILHDPRILILDEATSSVDTRTEKQIQEALARLTSGRTTIAIAHRLSTLRGAHRLIVLDHGRIAEQGTHEQLVASGGIYHDLVQTQSEMNASIAIGKGAA